MKLIRFKMRLLVLSIAATAAVLAPFTPAFAQATKDAKPDAKKTAAGGQKKSTSINFEDQLVEGEAQKPELFYLLQKKQFNHKRLIRLRDDFLPEMRKTSEDISRKGSGN